MVTIELIFVGGTCPTQPWEDIHTLKHCFIIAAALMQIRWPGAKKPLNCAVVKIKTVWKQHQLLQKLEPAFLLLHLPPVFVVLLFMWFSDLNLNHMWPSLHGTWHFSLQDPLDSSAACAWIDFVTNENATPWLLLLHSADLLCKQPLDSSISVYRKLQPYYRCHIIPMKGGFFFSLQRISKLET